MPIVNPSNSLTLVLLTAVTFLVPVTQTEGDNARDPTAIVSRTGGKVCAVCECTSALESAAQNKHSIRHNSNRDSKGYLSVQCSAVQCDRRVLDTGASSYLSIYATPDEARRSPQPESQKPVQLSALVLDVMLHPHQLSYILSLSR